MSKKRVNVEKYKPLSFSTTLRNPQRIGDFLKVVKKYDSKIMTNELCTDIYIDFVKSKVVYPQKAITENNWKDKFETSTLSEEDLNVIVTEYDNTHKEAGFDKGKPSRVDTYLRLIKELGLMYYEPNEKIVINKAGIEYVEAFENGDILTMQKIFMNSLINFQTNTPYRRNLAKFKPVPLLFNVIDVLAEKVGTAYICKEELPLVICSKNDDYEKIVNKIIEFRGFTDVDLKKEKIYSFIINDLNATEKFIKFDKLFVEATDDFLRKFRFAGLIDIKGLRYIKINNLINEITQNIKDLNSSYIEVENPILFNAQISEINSFVIDLFKNMTPNATNESLLQWIHKFEENEINIDNEIVNLTKSRRTTKICIEELQHIDDSLLLEFLYVIKMSKEFPDLNVYGNYGANEEGIPMFHAPGGNPDIVLESLSNLDGIIEVTLLGGRNQLQQELLPISRHLAKFKENHNNAFCWYVSRVIHDDVIRYRNFIKFDENLDIYLSNIQESISQINDAKNDYANFINIISS